MLKLSAVWRNDLLNQAGASSKRIADNGHFYGWARDTESDGSEAAHSSPFLSLLILFLDPLAKTGWLMVALIIVELLKFIRKFLEA